jgi:hypothetical protein
MELDEKRRLGVVGAAVDSVDLFGLEFIKARGFLGSFHGVLDCGVGDDLLGLGLVEFQALEIGRCDLQGVENQAGFLGLDFMAHDEFGYLAKSELDGVHVLENRQMNFRSGIIVVHAAIVESCRAAVLMVVAELVVL